MAAVATANRLNTSKVVGTLTANDQWIVYKWRGCPTAPATVRCEVTGTFTGTVSLQICQPGSTTGFEVDTSTAAESNVVTPGGDCDIILKTTAYTSGNIGVAIYSGKH